MATYDDERFLAAQLNSLVAFDASFDDPEKVVLVDGTRRGFAANFISARGRAPPAEYFAFCDHNDTWYRDKLAHAIVILSRTTLMRPALYCGRMLIADEFGRPPSQMSPAFLGDPSFANALVQSIARSNRWSRW